MPWNVLLQQCKLQAAAENFNSRRLLNKRKPEMETDMIYWFSQLKHLFLYAGTRGHVVDIINTFFYSFFFIIKPLLLTVLEVAKK